MEIDGLRNLRISVENAYDEPGRAVLKYLLNEICDAQLPVPSAARSDKLEELGVLKLTRSKRSLLPVCLRVQEFSEFVKNLPTISVPAENLQKYARFWEVLNEKFESGRNADTDVFEKGEDLKVEALAPHFNAIFADNADLITGHSIHKDLVDQTCNLRAGKVDLYAYLRSVGIPVLIKEVKNEETSTSRSEAIAQGATYYLKFIRSQKKAIISNAPCLLVSIRGLVIKVVGIVLFDGNVPTHSACECTLACFDGSDGDFAKFTRVMESIRRCAVNLSERAILDMQQYLLRPAEVLDTQCFKLRTPWKTRLEALNLSFTYTGVVMGGKTVFSAVCHPDSTCQPPNKRLIVKWIKSVEGDEFPRYGESVHLLMAQHGYAPCLYGIERVIAGDEKWLMIVMSDVSGNEDMVFVQDPDNLSERHCALEQEALACLHQAGYVHGDFRDSNVLIGDEAVHGAEVTSGEEVVQEAHVQIPRIFVLDFDWAGPHGVATYPVTLNPQVEWHQDAAVGGLIAPAHDVHFHNKRYSHLRAAEIDVAAAGEGVQAIALG